MSRIKANEKIRRYPVKLATVLILLDGGYIDESLTARGWESRASLSNDECNMTAGMKIRVQVAFDRPKNIIMNHVKMQLSGKKGAIAVPKGWFTIDGAGYSED